MAITFVNKGTLGAGTTLATPGLPAALLAGDLLLLAVHTPNQAVTTPAGWTPITSSPVSTGTANLAGGTRISGYYRFWQSGDVAPAVAVTGGGCTVAMIFAYRGVDLTTPFDGVTPTTNIVAAASTTLTMAGITTVTSNARVVHLVARDQDLSNAAAVATPVNANLTGMTERHDQVVNTGVGGGIYVQDGLKASPGATGNTTATQTSSIAVCLTVSLREQGTTGTVSRTQNANSLYGYALRDPVASRVVRAQPSGNTNSNTVSLSGVPAGTLLVLNYANTSAQLGSPNLLPPAGWAEIATPGPDVNLAWKVSLGGTETATVTLASAGTGNIELILSEITGLANPEVANAVFQRLEGADNTVDATIIPATTPLVLAAAWFGEFNNGVSPLFQNVAGDRLYLYRRTDSATIAYSIGAANGVSASINAPLAAIMVAFKEGVVTTSTGTVASTQAPNAAAAAGLVGIAGTAAGTQALNTSSASGSVAAAGISGTGAATQARNVSTARGVNDTPVQPGQGLARFVRSPFRSPLRVTVRSP